MSIGMDLAIGLRMGVFGKWRESRGLEGCGLSKILWKRVGMIKSAACKQVSRAPGRESMRKSKEINGGKDLSPELVLWKILCVQGQDEIGLALLGAKAEWVVPRVR